MRRGRPDDDDHYLPKNGPAIGDLMTLFDFGRRGHGDRDEDERGDR